MNIGSSMRYGLMTLLISASFMLHASDGDMQYSAPYIWVNPETGQVETVNPGPRLKAHPQMSDENATTKAEVMAATPAEEGGRTDGHEVTHVPVHQSLIVLVGMIAGVGVVVMMGRTRKEKAGTG